MPQTYIIEVSSQAAGIVVRNPDGYVFFAASQRFNRLDGQLFRNAREAERAARAPGRYAIACYQSLVAPRDNSFQSLPCFCQFIRMCRLVELFLPSATVSLSAIQ